MEYTSSEDVKRSVFAAMKEKGVTLTSLAEPLGTRQADLSRMLNRLNPSFNSIRDFVGSFGYKLVFDIVPKEDLDEIKK